MPRPRFCFDDGERTRESPPWEPEPLQLPLELPRVPENRRHDDPPLDVESRVIVIDLA